MDIDRMDPGLERSGPGPLIYVFSPSGAVLETHPVPAALPMRCAFGDADLGSLYVTTGEGHLYRAKAAGRRGVYGWPAPSAPAKEGSIS